MSAFKRLKWPDKNVPAANRCWYDGMYGLTPCVVVGFSRFRGGARHGSCWCKVRRIGVPRSWHGGIGLSEQVAIEFWTTPSQLLANGAEMNEYGTKWTGVRWTPKELEKC